MADLPPVKRAEFAAPDPAGDALKKRNAGREKEIDTIVGHRRACLVERFDRFAVEAARAAARPMGDVKLRKMTEMFRREDARTLDLINKDRSSLTAKERTAMDRIGRAYPIEAYTKALKQGIDDAMRGGWIGRTFAECDGRWEADLTRLGLVRAESR